MTLLQLKYIAMVAKCGSFSKAAQKLYVTQPGVSKVVRAVEEELDITIFARSSAGITLTADGKELLDMGSRLLNDADRITNHFKQDVTQNHERLSVSSQHYCFVIDAFTEIQRHSTSEMYTYKLLIGQTPDVIRQVSQKETEIGVLFIGEHNRKYMDRVFDENDLEFHEFMQSRPYVFIHKDHPLAGQSSVKLDELQPYPCIMYDLEADAPSVLMEEFMDKNFYPKKVSIISGLYQSVQTMVECNGYDLGSGVIAPSNKAAGVIKLPVDGFNMPISIGWICGKAYEPGPLAMSFVKELEKMSVDA